MSKDLIEKFQSFLSHTYVTIGNVKGRTMLPLPPMDSPALTKGIVNGSITASGGNTSGIYGLGDHHSHHGMSGGVAGPALRNQNSASLSTVKQKMNGSVSGSGGTATGMGPGGTHYS